MSQERDNRKFVIDSWFVFNSVFRLRLLACWHLLGNWEIRREVLHLCIKMYNRDGMVWRRTQSRRGESRLLIVLECTKKIKFADEDGMGNWG